MVFAIEGKIALVTGGASGIGLSTVKELLRNGLKGVTIADTNPLFGQKALKEIEQEFGKNRAIFVETDVTNLEKFENAFKKTIETFKNIDILINNAGIMNDAKWQQEILINFNGVVQGMLLGFDNYIPKHKSGDEGAIVNISSIAGLNPVAGIPIYCATKAAVHALTKSWGDKFHYERTKVKVVAICPGVTDTPLIQEATGKSLNEVFEKSLLDDLKDYPVQSTEELARSLVKVLRNGASGTAWVAEGGEEPYQYIVSDRTVFK